jgi:hypothetical protein
MKSGRIKERRMMEPGPWTKECEPNPFRPRLKYYDLNLLYMNTFIILINFFHQIDREPFLKGVPNKTLLCE